MTASMQVTATQGGGTFAGMLLRVLVLTAAADSPLGNTGTFSSGSDIPRATVTTTVTGSLVYGAIGITSGDVAFTARSGTTLIDNFDDNTNFTRYGTCRATAATGTPGATTVGASGPSGNMTSVVAEILPNGVITEDASAPAVATTKTATTVTTASFTPPPGALLVALVSSDGSGGSPATMGVAGGGVIWSEVAFANGAGINGYCGIWLATVGQPLPDDPLITVTQTGSTFVGMTARIKVLTGAAKAAQQTGATAVQSATAAHQASVTTTQQGSIVYGGYASNSNTAPTAAGGTTLLDSFADATNGNYYGTCRTTAATGTPGATTVGASAPSSIGSIALAEILPATPGGTITEDGSSPASVSTTSSITVQVNVISPPSGSLLVLLVGADGNTSVNNLTVSGGGLTWRALAEAHAAGDEYGGVWVADIPALLGGQGLQPPEPPRYHPRLARRLGSLPVLEEFEPWPPWAQYATPPPAGPADTGLGSPQRGQGGTRRPDPGTGSSATYT